MAQLHIADWSSAAISSECNSRYRQYVEELDKHHARYLETYPEKGSDHPKKVIDLAAALPEGLDFLADELPAAELHPHHLSGKSSQVLALGLLGSAKKADPTLDWLFASLHPVLPSPAATRTAEAKLERRVPATLLNERPNQTAIDFLVQAEDIVVCVEAKWAEPGLGSCSCQRNGGDPSTSKCADRMLERPLYWESAEEDLGLGSREVGRPCPISTPYQAVRNAAAARAMATEGQTPAFALIYDERNPYFGGCGDWPGWPSVLDEAMNQGAPGRVRFSSASWQELFRNLPRDEAVDAWAKEKHQLKL